MTDSTPRDGDAERLKMIMRKLVEIGSLDSVSEAEFLEQQTRTRAAALREAEARGYKRAIDSVEKMLGEMLTQITAHGVVPKGIRIMLRCVLRNIRPLADQPQPEQEVMPYSKHESGGAKPPLLSSSSGAHNAQPPSVVGGGEPTRKPLLGPECMMPDGGNVCLGFQILKEAWLADKDRADRILAALQKGSAELRMYIDERIKNRMPYESVIDVILRAVAEHLRKTT